MTFAALEKDRRRDVKEDANDDGEAFPMILTDHLEPAQKRTQRCHHGKNSQQTICLKLAQVAVE